jgi:hypothetical protein
MILAITILILLNIPSTETCPIFSKNAEIMSATMDAVLFFLSKKQWHYYFSRLLPATLSGRLHFLFGIIHLCQSDEEGGSIC